MYNFVHWLNSVGWIALDGVGWIALDGVGWIALDGVGWLALDVDVRHLSDVVGRVLIFFKFAVETVVTSVSTA